MPVKSDKFSHRYSRAKSRRSKSSAERASHALLSRILDSTDMNWDDISDRTGVLRTPHKTCVFSARRRTSHCSERGFNTASKGFVRSAKPFGLSSLLCAAFDKRIDGDGENDHGSCDRCSCVGRGSQQHQTVADNGDNQCAQYRAGN